jgi:hypothetical protein
MEVVITFRSEGCFLDIQLSHEIHEVDFNHAITPCTGVVRPKRDSPPAYISFLRLNVSPGVLAAPKISSMAVPFNSAIRDKKQAEE